MSDVQRNFVLEVADFGPIMKAKIDLRPLTVFIGPSNTGKSYLATVIYALHRTFSIRTSLQKRIPKVFRNSHTDLLPPEFIQFIHFIQSLTAEKNDVGTDFAESFTATIGAISSLFDDEYLSKEIERCFGLKDISKLIRKRKKGGAFISWIRPGDFLGNKPETIINQLTIRSKRTEFTTNFDDVMSNLINSEKMNEEIRIGRALARFVSSGQIDERVLDATQLGLVINFFVSFLTDAFDSGVYYLPADRTGIMHAYNLIVASLIASASRARNPIGSTPALSGVSADFLEQLFGLDPQQKSVTDFGKRIEKSIFRGLIGVEKSEIGYPLFSFRPEGWEENLSLMNASSMISELTPIVLYLRHIVNPGDVLIIEEPESHLHPAMQVEFIRQLVPAVSAGIKVVITTHSEWLLEELGNIVQRSEIPLSRSNENDRAFSLRSKDVGAWLFNPKRRPFGSVVTEIDLSESGLYPAGFDEVAISLHNDWARIRDKIGMKNDN